MVSKLLFDLGPLCPNCRRSMLSPYLQVPSAEDSRADIASISTKRRDQLCGVSLGEVQNCVQVFQYEKGKVRS